MASEASYTKYGYGRYFLLFFFFHILLNKSGKTIPQQPQPHFHLYKVIPVHPTGICKLIITSLKNLIGGVS